MFIKIKKMNILILSILNIMLKPLSFVLNILHLNKLIRSFSIKFINTKLYTFIINNPKWDFVLFLDKFSGNALFEISLKSKDYIYYLLTNFYSYICIKNYPRAYPNHKSDKPVESYIIHSKSLTSLTALYSIWYFWSDGLQIYIKIVPLNIVELLTPLALAIWLQDDGFWHKTKGTVFICTHFFTEKEVDLLIETLFNNFGLIASKNQGKALKNNTLSFLIRFSKKNNDLNNLISLVKPHFINSMIYKLGSSLK